MKKNIIIGILSITSAFFFIAAYVQKTQNEELEIQLREAENLAIENQKLVEQAILVAIEARNAAEENLKLAYKSAKRAEEAAKKEALKRK